MQTLPAESGIGILTVLVAILVLTEGTPQCSYDVARTFETGSPVTFDQAVLIRFTGTTLRQTSDGAVKPSGQGLMRLSYEHGGGRPMNTSGCLTATRPTFLIGDTGNPARIVKKRMTTLAGSRIVNDPNMVVATVDPVELINALSKFAGDVVKDLKGMIDFMSRMTAAMQAMNRVQERLQVITAIAANSSGAYTDMKTELEHFNMFVLSPFMAQQTLTRYSIWAAGKSDPAFVANTRALDALIDFPLAQPAIYAGKCEMTNDGKARGSVLRAHVTVDCVATIDPSVDSLRTLDTLIAKRVCWKAIRLYRLLQDDAYAMTDPSTWPPRYKLPAIDSSGQINQKLGIKYIAFTSGAKVEVAKWSDYLGFDYVHEAFMSNDLGYGGGDPVRDVRNPTDCSSDSRRAGEFYMAGLFPGTIADLFATYQVPEVKPRLHKLAGAFVGESVVQRWKIVDAGVLRCCSYSNGAAVVPDVELIDFDFSFNSGLFIEDMDEIPVTAMNYARDLSIQTPPLEYGSDRDGTYFAVRFSMSMRTDNTWYTCNDYTIRSVSYDQGYVPMMQCPARVYKCDNGIQYYTQRYARGASLTPYGPVLSTVTGNSCQFDTPYCQLTKDYNDMGNGLFVLKPNALQYQVVGRRCFNATAVYCRASSCSERAFQGFSTMKMIDSEGNVCDFVQGEMNATQVVINEIVMNVTYLDAKDWTQSINSAIAPLQALSARTAEDLDELARAIANFTLATAGDDFNLTIVYYQVGLMVDRKIQDAAKQSDFAAAIVGALVDGVNGGSSIAKAALDELTETLRDALSLPSGWQQKLISLLMWAGLVLSILGFFYFIWTCYMNRRQYGEMYERAVIRIRKDVVPRDHSGAFGMASMFSLSIDRTKPSRSTDQLSDAEVNASEPLRFLAEHGLLKKFPHGYMINGSAAEEAPVANHGYELNLGNAKFLVFALRHGGYAINL